MKYVAYELFHEAQFLHQRVVFLLQLPVLLLQFHFLFVDDTHLDFLLLAVVKR